MAHGTGVFRRAILTLVVMGLVAGFLMAANPVVTWEFTEAVSNYNFNPAAIQVNAGNNSLAQVIVTPWCNTATCTNAWTRRMTINVTNAGATINGSYFVPVQMTNADVAFWNSEQTTTRNGGEVRFTAGDGSTALPFWTAPSTWTPGWNIVARTATYWVQLPAVPSGITQIFLYFGNPNGASLAAADPFQFFGIGPAYAGSMYYAQYNMGANQYIAIANGPFCNGLGDGVSCNGTGFGVGYPYFSTNTYTVARGTGNIYLYSDGCFDLISNANCPASASSMNLLAANDHIAAYWDDMLWSAGAPSEGIYFLAGGNCTAQYNHGMDCFVFRWVAEENTAGATAAGRNFSVVTYANGNLQFNYGPFSGITNAANPKTSGISTGSGYVPGAAPNPVRSLYCGGANPANCTGPMATYNNANSLVYFARPYQAPEPTAAKGAIENFPGTLFSTSNPSIDNSGAVLGGPLRPVFGALYSFADTVPGACTLPSCAVTFQISPDGGTFYWYDAGQTKWVAAPSGYATSNDVATVNAQIGRFMSDLGISSGGGFTWKTFLHSDGTVQTSIDNITLTYSASRPDALIKDDAANPSFIGASIYNVDAQQTASNTVNPNTTVTYTTEVVNRGSVIEPYKVLGDTPAQPAQWTVQYLDPGNNDVTASVEAGTYQTAPVPINGAFLIVMKVTPSFLAPGGVAMPFRVKYTSTITPTIFDSVLGSTTPTITRNVAEDIDTDPTFPLPTSASAGQTVPNNVTATYYVKVTNAGNVSETNDIVLRANTSPATPTGWTIKYYPYTLGSCAVDDVFSGSVAGTGARITTTLAAGSSNIYCILVTPTSSASGGDTVTVNFTASNLTDTTKTATVQAITQVTIVYRPDLSMDLNALNLAQDQLNIPFGNNVYDPSGASESVATPTSGATTIFYLRADNDGNTFDQLKITGNVSALPVGTDSNWTVRFFDAQSGGNDVTSSVTASGVVIGLNKATNKIYRVEVTPNASVNGGDTLTVGVNIVSVNDPSKQDKVIGTVQMTSHYQPDGLISLTPNQPDFVGGNIYDASQIASAQTGPGSTATYYLEVRNNGNTADNLVVTGTAAPAGWTVNYFDEFSGGNNITAAVTGAGFTTAPIPPPPQPPAAQVFIPLRVEVTPTGPHNANDTLSVSVTATSTNDATKKDTVRADTVVGFIPDLWISTTAPGGVWTCDVVGGPPQCGVGIIDTNGTSGYQLKLQSTPTSATYYMIVSNFGLQDDIIVNGTGDTNDGWTLSYFDSLLPNTGRDITALVTSGGWHTGQLNTGDIRWIRLVVTPGPNVPLGAKKATFLTARSSQGVSSDTVRTSTSVTSPSGSVAGLDLVIDGNGSGVQGAILPPPGTGLGGTSSKTVVVSQTQTYQIQVNNTGTTSDTYTLTWTSPAGWTVTFNDGTPGRASGYVTPAIPAGQALPCVQPLPAPAGCFLEVTPPLGTSPAQYPIILNGQSVNDGSKVDSIKAVANVVAIVRSVDATIDGNGAGITGAVGTGLGGSAFHSVPAGGTGIFVVTVTNTGNIADSYQMLWTTPPGYTALLNDGVADRASGYVTAPIPQGFNRIFTFKVTTPANATRVGLVLDVVSTAAAGTSFDSLDAVTDPSLGGAATQLTIQKGAAIPGPITANPGDVGVRLVQLQLSADSLGNDVSIHSLQLHAAGLGNAVNSITAVKVWDDANGDGVPDGPNYLAIGSFTSSNGTVLLTPGTPLTVSKGTTHNYVVTLDFATKVSKAPVLPGSRPGSLPGFGFLALLGLALVGFRRKALWPVLLGVLLLGLAMAGCNSGGGTLPAQYVDYTYSATIGPGDVQASDAVTQNPAAVLYNPPAGFSSGTVTIHMKVSP